MHPSHKIWPLLVLVFSFSAQAQDTPLSTPEVPDEPEFTIEQLVQRALQNNQQLPIARQTQEAAQQRLNALQTRQNPTLQVVPRLIGNRNAADEDIILAQPLDVFGKRRAQAGVAAAELRRAQADMTLAERSLVVQVKNAGADLFAAQEAKGGATYEVAMMPMPMPIVAGQDTMLHFQIRDAKGKPLKDLQPYLGAMGHCVILSSDTNAYLHSHPMAAGAEHDMSKMGAMDMSKMNETPAPKSSGPDVMFHTNFPSAGLYKVWGQFKHKGQIITAAFVVNVGTGRAGMAASDEAKPHTH